MKNKMKTFLVGLVGIIAFIYLLNPTAGFLEFIPDNIPLIGNLDEAGAVTIIIASLGYFGIDVSSLFTQKNSTEVKEKKLK